MTGMFSNIMRRLDITKSHSRSRVRENGFLCTVTALTFIVLMLLSAPSYTLGFSLFRHQNITEEALPFLDKEISSRIVHDNKDEDECLPFHCPGWHRENHFDACDYGDSTININKKHMKSANKDYPFSAAGWFGRGIHTAQDFYSHSNWAEIDALWSSMNGGYHLPIVDNLVTPWEEFRDWDNIRSLNVWSTSEENRPDSWILSAPLTPEGITPEIIEEDTSTSEGWGLFTHGRGSGDDCSDETDDWEHPELNKDDPIQEPDADPPDNYKGDLSKYETLFEKARLFAIDQTNHEFCRNLNLVKSEFGYQRASIIMGLWVEDADRMKFSESSPCHPQKNGDTKVNVTIKSIKINNDNDDDDDNPGDLNLKFVLYSGDFRQATGHKTEQVTIFSGTQWPEDKLPSPLTMCVDSHVPLMATVQGWDDENAESKGIFNPVKYDFSDPTNPTIILNADEVLKGVTKEIPTIPVPLPRYELHSKSMDVLFEVKAVPSSPECPLDTDDDGIFDIDDNCPTIANPRQEDVDGNGIGDACEIIT